MSKEAEYESKERIFFENWMTENDYEYDNIPIEELLQAYADQEKVKLCQSILDDCDLYASDQYRIMSIMDNLKQRQ